MITLCEKRKDFPIKISAVLFLIVIITVFILGWKESVLEEVQLTSKCSFTLTEDAPSSHDLPVLVLNTNGHVLTADVNGVPVEVSGVTVNLLEAAPEFMTSFKLYENCDVQKPDIEATALVNVRGQSSRSLPKKQYSIDFELDEVSNHDIEILGMPKHTKWVLNGTYQDKSLIRNYLAYQMGRDVMEYSPRTRFVELYINDTNEELSYEKHYKGLYMIIEKIERGPNRVNIKKIDNRYNDISFIIARDKVKLKDIAFENRWGKLDEEYTVDSHGKVRLRTVVQASYPSSNKLTKEYSDKITKYVNDFEDTLYSSKFKDPANGYRKYIDVDSFVELAMVNEIFKNIDGGEVSTYFYKDVAGKLKAGPLWDFDLTLGNTPTEEVNEPTGFRIVNTVWFNRLFQDPYFCEIYKKKYIEYRKTVWTNEALNNRIDEVILYLGEAERKNYAVWYSNDSSYSFDLEVQQVKDFLFERLNWMDENIDNIRRYEDLID